MPLTHDPWRADLLRLNLARSHPNRRTRPGTATLPLARIFPPNPQRYYCTDLTSSLHDDTLPLMDKLS